MTLALQDDDLEFDGATTAIHCKRRADYNTGVTSVQISEQNNNCNGGRETNINEPVVPQRRKSQDNAQRASENEGSCNRNSTVKSVHRKRVRDDGLNFISLPVECSSNGLGSGSLDHSSNDNAVYVSLPSSSTDVDLRYTFGGEHSQNYQILSSFLQVDQDSRNTVRSTDVTPISPNYVRETNQAPVQSRHRLDNDLPSVNLISDESLSSTVDNLPSVDLGVTFFGNRSKKRLKSSGITSINNGLQNLNLRSSQISVLPENDDTPYWTYILKPDSEGDNLLFAAILDKRTSLALEMINLIPDYRLLTRVNNLRQSALHLAALTDNYVIARRLVVAGAKVHLQDNNGNTPLHIAATRGNVRMAEALLSPVRYTETLINSFEIPYQAIPQDLNIRNYQGQTCMVLATVHRRLKIINLLLDMDADINTRDMKTGKTCLHIAAESGDLELVQFIASKPKVDLDAETYSGYTAVELACFRNHSHVALALSFKGASEARIFEDDIE